MSESTGIYISEKVRKVNNTLINPSTEEKQDSIAALIQTLANQGDDGLYLLTRMSDILRPLTLVTGGSNRLSIDVNNIIAGTITTVSTVSNVANQTNIGGLSAFDMQYNMGRMAYATSIGNFQ